MESYSVYFVRHTNIELVRSVFGNVETLPDSEWLMCAFLKNANPPEDAVLFGESSLTITLSEKLGEVIFLYGDTSNDGFVYEHADDGQQLRKLVWFPMSGDDVTAYWVYVAGNHEAWEDELFTERELAQYLQEEQERLEKSGQIEEFTSLAAEITRTWQNKNIIQGKKYPRCDGSVTLLVEKSYGIHRT